MPIHLNTYRRNIGTFESKSHKDISHKKRKKPACPAEPTLHLSLIPSLESPLTRPSCSFRRRGHVNWKLALFVCALSSILPTSTSTSTPISTPTNPTSQLLEEELSFCPTVDIMVEAQSSSCFKDSSLPQLTHTPNAHQERKLWEGRKSLNQTQYLRVSKSTLAKFQDHECLDVKGMDLAHSHHFATALRSQPKGQFFEGPEILVSGLVARTKREIPNQARKPINIIRSAGLIEENCLNKIEENIPLDQPTPTPQNEEILCERESIIAIIGDGIDQSAYPVSASLCPGHASPYMGRVCKKNSVSGGDGLHQGKYRTTQEGRTSNGVAGKIHALNPNATFMDIRATSWLPTSSTRTIPILTESALLASFSFLDDLTHDVVLITPPSQISGYTLSFKEMLQEMVLRLQAKGISIFSYQKSFSKDHWLSGVSGISFVNQLNAVACTNLKLEEPEKLNAMPYVAAYTSYGLWGLAGFTAACFTYTVIKLFLKKKPSLNDKSMEMQPLLHSHTCKLHPPSNSSLSSDRPLDYLDLAITEPLNDVPFENSQLPNRLCKSCCNLSRFEKTPLSETPINHQPQQAKTRAQRRMRRHQKFIPEQSREIRAMLSGDTEERLLLKLHQYWNYTS